MRLVVAVGGNAMLERGEVPVAEVQEGHMVTAVEALAPLARDHDLVITHGNGPQVGLVANESALDPVLPHPYPFDVVGAQTQGMIGYFLLQAFENALPGHVVVSLICQTEVAADDPAFVNPTKFVGPVYSAPPGGRGACADARGHAGLQPRRALVTAPVAGSARDPTSRAEAVIDKDLARPCADADALILTDVAHVEIGYGTPTPDPSATPPRPS